MLALKAGVSVCTGTVISYISFFSKTPLADVTREDLVAMLIFSLSDVAEAVFRPGFQYLGRWLQSEGSVDVHKEFLTICNTPLDDFLMILSLIRLPLLPSAAAEITFLLLQRFTIGGHDDPVSDKF